MEPEDRVLTMHANSMVRTNAKNLTLPIFLIALGGTIVHASSDVDIANCAKRAAIAPGASVGDCRDAIDSRFGGATQTGNIDAPNTYISISNGVSLDTTTNLAYIDGISLPVGRFHAERAARPECTRNSPVPISIGISGSCGEGYGYVGRGYEKGYKVPNQELNKEEKVNIDLAIRYYETSIQLGAIPDVYIALAYIYLLDKKHLNYSRAFDLASTIERVADKDRIGDDYWTSIHAKNIKLHIYLRGLGVEKGNDEKILEYGRTLLLGLDRGTRRMDSVFGSHGLGPLYKKDDVLVEVERRMPTFKGHISRNAPTEDNARLRSFMEGKRDGRVFSIDATIDSVSGDDEFVFATGSERTVYIKIDGYVFGFDKKNDDRSKLMASYGLGKVAGWLGWSKPQAGKLKGKFYVYDYLSQEGGAGNANSGAQIRLILKPCSKDCENRPPKSALMSNCNEMFRGVPSDKTEYRLTGDGVLFRDDIAISTFQNRVLSRSINSKGAHITHSVHRWLVPNEKLQRKVWDDGRQEHSFVEVFDFQRQTITDRTGTDMCFHNINTPS